MKEVTISEFFEYLKIQKKVNSSELMEASGRTLGNLSAYSRRGSINLKTLYSILNGVGEDLVLKLKNGDEFKIKITAKNTNKKNS